MSGFLDSAYPWLKSAHLIFVIFWMAGLFMLPRFFIYHQEEPPGSAQDKKWIEREDRLRKIILAPSMVVVWLLGLLLAWYIGAFAMGWFHAKLLLVLILTGFHGWMVGYGKKLAAGERKVGDKALRLANEVPGIAIPLIVILVIVKPF
jgi:protoporphyrinogen IX oxidase